VRVVAAVILCLGLWGCKTQQSKSLHVDASLESLVPSDTVAIAGADLESIRGTLVYEKLLGRLPIPQLDEFTRQTGLDPRKDLSQLLFSTNGKHGLLMARGKFRRPDLERRLESNGASRFSHKNYRLFGSEERAIFFLNDSIAVAGPAAELRSMIDKQSPRGIPPALSAQIRTLPASDQIYAALIGGIEGMNFPVPAGSNAANALQVLRSIDTGALGMDLSHGINLLLRVSSKSERDAKFVHDMVKGLVGLGRLNTPDNQPELLKLYDAIQVQQDQTMTTVMADIPQDLAERFLDLWLKRQ